MSVTKTITNVDTLKINYLTQEMYEDALESDEINDNELYLTRSESNEPLIIYSIDNDDGHFLDKTYVEIWQAIKNGRACYLYCDSSGNDCTSYNYKTGFFPLTAYKYNTSYRIYVYMPHTATINNTDYIGTPGICTFGATNATDYPKFLRATYVSSSALYDNGSLY